MGGRASSSKRKLKRDKISSKKKSRRKESKKRRRNYDSATSSDDDSLYLEHSLSTSKSDHKRRKTKNKKRRRDSSLSSYSDYQSVSSDSDLSSTDDNDHKIRKVRRSRVSLKDTKGKGRKRSTSSIGDVDATSGRKRKRIGRDHDIRPVKKPSKKKPKKDLSSSSSSDSESQSGSSSSSADDKRQRKRVVSDKEKGRVKGRGSHKGRPKHKDRSPSYTSVGRDSNPGFTVGNCDEEFFPVDYSRRLRSVITVVDQPRNDEDNRWEKDPNKEEIVYDQNDYPSPKSLDSNEGGTKMDSDNQFNVAVSGRICIENIAGEEVSELEKSRIDEGEHGNAGDRQSEEGFINYSEEKEINKSVPVDALGGDALESILRLKALENLRKFRERPQASPRSNMVKTNNVARLSDETVDTIQNESIEQGSTDAQEINKRSGLLLQRETAEVVKLPDSETVEKKSVLAKQNITHQTAEVVKLPDSETVEKKSVLAKQNITHPNNGAALLQCSEKDRSACSEAVAAEAVSGSNTSPGAGGTKACSSSNVEPTSGEHSSEQGNEAKDGSQFEQKTMTVMRGGELVQVSYKVYIPNKAQALARRQLRR